MELMEAPMRARRDNMQPVSPSSVGCEAHKDLCSILENEAGGSAYEHTLLQWRKVNEPTKGFKHFELQTGIYEVVLAKHQILNSALPSTKILTPSC